MRPLIAGNWKENCTIAEAVRLASELKDLVKNIKNVDIVVCPPFTALDRVKDILRKTNIMLGAQDVFYEEKGAFTSEISPLMLIELGCRFVIVGHSERREYFMETDLAVNRKIKACLKHGLTPIMCVGETQQERSEGITEKVIEREITEGLDGITKKEIEKIVISYEPIWAISGGDPTHQPATPQDAQQAHKFIRNMIARMYSREISGKIRIIYGGSMKAENAKEFMAQPDINGGLVGGASLDAGSFAEIVKKSV